MNMSATTATIQWFHTETAMMLPKPTYSTTDAASIRWRKPTVPLQSSVPRKITLATEK